MKKFYSFLLLGLLLSVGNAWAGYEKATSIAVGDKVVLVCESASKELTGFSSTSTVYGIGTAYTTTPNGTMVFDVVAGSSNGTFAFKNGNNYLNWESGNSLTVSTTLSANTSWDVTFNNGNAIILNAKDTNRKLRWNSGSPRFACYSTSEQTAIQLYKMVNASVEAPTFSPVGGTYHEAQNITLACSTNGAAIYYTLDGTDPTNNSNLYTTPIAISETKTIKAIAIVGNESSSIASATYTIFTPTTISAVRAQGTGSVCTQGVVTSCVGTTGYIQDANAAICVFGANLTVGDEITVSGTLSTYNGLLEITSPVVNVLSSGNTVNPVVKTIAEINADTEYALQGLLVKIEDAEVSAINNQNVTIKQSTNTITVRFANADAVTATGIAVNDFINLVGNIGCYNGAQIANPTDVQIEVPVAVPSIDVEETSINVPYTGALDGVINVTYNNITEIVAEVAFFESDGTTPLAQEPDWIVADIDIQTHNLVYVVDVNEGAARTAYMKVVALDDEANDVYSELITVTQSACVYATLPFEYDGNGQDSPVGMTNNGVGSYSSGSPAMKFDGTGDEIILRINENAGVLSFDIKGNSFSGGTFSVQVSTDGSNYSDLDVITKLASTPANMAYSLAAGVRYIKWIYTNKSNGNVALGNIKVRKPAAAITLGANGYSTFAADFKYTVSGAEVYEAALNNAQDAIILTKVENAVVPANAGIILKGTEGATVTITPSNNAASDFAGNELVGVLAPTEVEANWYVLATNRDGDGLTKFHNCQAGVEIPANKAYMVIGEATAPSIRIIEAGNEATDIQNVEGAEKAVKFMENGKLYIQKNGVVYDAMGKTVR